MIRLVKAVDNVFPWHANVDFGDDADRLFRTFHVPVDANVPFAPLTHGSSSLPLAA